MGPPRARLEWHNLDGTALKEGGGEEEGVGVAEEVTTRVKGAVTEMSRPKVVVTEDLVDPAAILEVDT